MTASPRLAPQDRGALHDVERPAVVTPEADTPLGAHAVRPAEIAYFAHFVDHPDIPRRIEMLRNGGAQVRVLGFHRNKAAAMPFVDLGPTQDANFVQRVMAVLKAIASVSRWGRALEGADVVVARNLEMLAVAAVARQRYAPKARLIYECLDIHRLMSGRGPASRLLRAIERALLERADGLMVSSPGFVREYFAKLTRKLPPVILVENKVGMNEAVPAREAVPRPAAPPWRIGWFGVIRCRRSLDLLIEATRRRPGLFEVVIAGRPAKDVVGDLARDLPEDCGVRYVGSFADENALAQLYRSVHFTWLPDFYEAGANSDWLLANRLYRAVYYGAVPIALRGVETGRWLAAHDAGLMIDEASPETVIALLEAMTSIGYDAAKTALERIPTSALVNRREDCVNLVEQLSPPGERGAA